MDVVALAVPQTPSFQEVPLLKFYKEENKKERNANKRGKSREALSLLQVNTWKA